MSANLIKISLGFSEKMGYDPILVGNNHYNRIYNSLFDNNPLLLTYMSGSSSAHTVVVNGISIYNSGKFTLSLINSVASERTTLTDFDLVEVMIGMKR